ncbi:acyltransferase family protein [Teichococcus vastitatis]|uniref:acyltransferase family protein n=1 Tax=Teichococcus vastitatis TaxID=2307076 RepID=UPI0013006641|nr:acyltransferase [Pseudoroseomonas vastitatis]
MTGARGPAALAVVAYHLPMDSTTPSTTNWFGLEALFTQGDLGVDFFFILSGFIIHHVYRNVFAGSLRMADVRRFVLYRFARIWPLHIVTMLGALTLYAAAVLLFHRMPADAASYSPSSVLANILMVQSWFGIGSPNVPAWSISAEWAAYLVFPFACWLLMRLPLVAWIGLGLAAWLLTGTEFITHPLGRIATGFLMGMVLRECEGRFALAHRLGRATGLMVLGLLLAGCWVLPDTALLPYTFGFAVLILALSNPADWLARLAARRPLVYLGEISFALYMVHAVVWSAFKNLLRIAAPGIDPTSYLPVLVGTVLSLIAASLLYHLVEIPGRNMLRRARRPVQQPEVQHGMSAAEARPAR